MELHPELSWKGYVNKKAFKTVAKQSWKRRYCQFDADSLTLSWHAAEGGKSLGEFPLEPTRLLAMATKEHAKPYEFKVECKGQVFYGCTESELDRQHLLFRIDMARRAKLAGDNGSVLILKSDAKIGTNPEEPGKKVFMWGTGGLLGNGIETAQGWSLPQRNTTFRASLAPKDLAAGPEHASCVDTGGGIHLWGSNEFGQGGVSYPASSSPPPLFKPTPLASLGTRKVLSVACGGSHTLAVVADSLAANGGAVVGWGTGTVGQLGLGSETQFCDVATVIALPEEYGRVIPVAKVYAGIVTSAVVTVTGDCFVWGDGSLGRLGLLDLPDSVNEKGNPVLVNFSAAVAWKPTKLTFNPTDFGAPTSTRMTVTQVALGGSFSMFTLFDGTGPGNILAVTGALGVDITRDKYGYDEEPNDTGAPTPVDNAIEAEIKGIGRRLSARPMAPFDARPVVYSISAGARHAAVISTLDSAEGIPKLYTAGKGWLGHEGTDDALLPRPTVSTVFKAVGGRLAAEEVVDAACGHSHTVALTSSGKAYAWGRGDSGELGHGSMTDRTMPTLCLTPEGHRFVQVIAGSYYSGALAEPGAARKSSPELLAQQTEQYRTQKAEEDKIIAQLTQPAAPAPAAEEENQPLPPGWDYDYDPEGTIYFIRPDGETQWEDPRDQ